MIFTICSRLISFMGSKHQLDYKKQIADLTDKIDWVTFLIVALDLNVPSCLINMYRFLKIYPEKLFLRIS